ncbi:MAG: HAMP domain-containing protein, partial [Nevskiales bacterium]
MSRKQRLLIGITSRLRLWHKVLFGCAVLIVPTAVLLYYFTTAANDAIRFAAKERCGVAYLQVLREMIGRTQSPGAGIGDLLTRLDAVESQTCLSGSYREELQAGDLSDLVRRDWRTYDAQPRQQPDPRSQSRLYALFAQVGDMSNLILDPDLDTYYMMDLILLRFPESMQMLTRVAATHEGALTEYAAINRHIGNVEHSLRVAVDNNDYYPGSRGTLYSAIDRSRDTYLAAMRQVLASLDGQISPEDRLAATNAARAALLNLYDQGAIWLDRALQARIAEKIRWKYQTYAIFGSLLVFAFGFAYLTANNIVGRLMELVAVSRRIAGGDMTQRIQVSSRDEIGQLAESFNLMTDRVEKWTTEMTAANEALRAEVAERERLEQEAGRRTQELETKNEEQRRREKVMISLLNDLRAAEIKLKQVAAKLESSNKELEQFAYVASHDLQ